MSGPKIPDVVINRLPLYARALALLQAEGREVVSSQQLGQELGVTAAQFRKDLAYFGRFGRQGQGYDVPQLIDRLRAILGLDREWRLALVGAGRLGSRIQLKAEAVAGGEPRVDVVHPVNLDGAAR